MADGKLPKGVGGSPLFLLSTLYFCQPRLFKVQGSRFRGSRFALDVRCWMFFLHSSFNLLHSLGEGGFEWPQPGFFVHRGAAYCVMSGRGCRASCALQRLSFMCGSCQITSIFTADPILMRICAGGRIDYRNGRRNNWMFRTS